MVKDMCSAKRMSGPAHRWEDSATASTTEQSAIQAYLGPDNHSLPHHRPQSRRLPLGVVAIIIALSHIHFHFLPTAIES
jgi:hypothetical protein